MSQIDALLPPEMAAQAEDIGVKKAALPWQATCALAVLAGAFISLGALFSTVVATGTSAAWPYGVARLLIGIVFSLGLILVVVGGAELFTGNNLLVMAWVSRRVSTRRLLRNWALVYAGNLLGALGTAALVFLSGHYRMADGMVGVTILHTASAKLGRPFLEEVALGTLCNALVCLAVWLSYSARSTTDRILVIVPPIAAFVAAGFEHSIANMYFFPVALLVKALAPRSFWQQIGQTPDDYPALSGTRAIFENLVPVTLGNLIGGVLLVGLMYWFIYRRRPAP